MPTKLEYSIVMVFHPGQFDPQDYVHIGKRITEQARDIVVHVVPDRDQPAEVYAKLAELKSLTFCPTHIKKFRSPRGKVFCGQEWPKSEQMRLLAKGGIRVPHWTMYSPHKNYSESEWGKFVILKPNEYGYASKGRGVELVRTAALGSPLAARSKRSAANMMVQRFLDTGEFSEDYRVVTMFGRALYALKRRSLTPLDNLDAIGSDRTTKGVVSNATAAAREAHYCYEKDILAFAESIYLAAPQVPFQAIDVRRDRNDGRLYCLEFNPGGNTWNFSSKRAQDIPTIDDIRREDQFGAWDIAAKALIEQTRLHAC